MNRRSTPRTFKEWHIRVRDGGVFRFAYALRPIQKGRWLSPAYGLIPAPVVNRERRDLPLTGILASYVDEQTD